MIDSVWISVKAGDGGAGAVSFRRERYVPRGGPDGGDGGRGGDVVVTTHGQFSTLAGFQRNRIFRAKDGHPGRGQGSHGRKGEDCVLYVPVGTGIYSEGLDIPEMELLQPGQRVVLINGGRGGRGNRHFATAVNQTPRFAEPGEKGKEKRFRLELRVLADVGLVGLPNVGKSTLLSRATAARPKIGAYQLTTLEPQLGVVEIGYETFTLADVPGIIGGGHLGVGLGSEFLQHVQRTRVLAHIVSGETEDALKDVLLIDEELGQFDPRLRELPQVLVVNKIDLPEVRACTDKIRAQLRPLGRSLYFISAATGEGVPELMGKVLEALQSQRQEKATEAEKEGFQVFHPPPLARGQEVRRENGKCVLVGPRVPRVVVSRDVSKGEHISILRERLRRTGWLHILEKAGVRSGDIVKVGDVEFAW